MAAIAKKTKLNIVAEQVVNYRKPIEPKEATLRTARMVGIRCGLVKVLSSVLDQKIDFSKVILVEDSYDLGRLALALKHLAEGLGGPEGSAHFNDGFEDDPIHNGGPLDNALFL